MDQNLFGIVRMVKIATIQAEGAKIDELAR